MRGFNVKILFSQTNETEAQIPSSPDAWLGMLSNEPPTVFSACTETLVTKCSELAESVMNILKEMLSVQGSLSGL